MMSQYVCVMSQYYSNGVSAPENHVRNKIIYELPLTHDVSGHSWGDTPIICTSDAVTRKNYWRFTPLVTTNIVINGSPYIILYIIELFWRMVGLWFVSWLELEVTSTNVYFPLLWSKCMNRNTWSLGTILHRPWIYLNNTLLRDTFSPTN